MELNAIARLTASVDKTPEVFASVVLHAGSRLALMDAYDKQDVAEFRRSLNVEEGAKFSLLDPSVQAAIIERYYATRQPARKVYEEFCRNPRAFGKR